MINTTESTMNPVEMACCSSDKAFTHELSSRDLSAAPESYINWGSTLWDFKALYQMELGENFKCHLGAIEGFRRTDGQKVGIKPVYKLQRRETPEYCEDTESLYKEELMPPASDHIARALEVFVMRDFDMVIVETLPSYVTLSDFLKEKKGKLTEAEVKAIMLQVFTALHDSWERGLVLNVSLEGLAINPNTLHVKVVDFRLPHQDAEDPGIRGDKPTSEEWMKERSKLQGTDNIFKVMQALVKNIKRPLWKTRRPSKECTDLLRRLKTYRGLWLLRTLNGVFTDPWLVSIALRTKRDGENCSSFSPAGHR